MSSDASDSESSAASFQDEISDVDAPRVAQWVDDEDAGDSEDESDAQPVAGPSPSNLGHIQNDISSLPMGALRKAQLSLQATVSDEASDNSDSGGSESDDPAHSDSEPGPNLTRAASFKDDTRPKYKSEIPKRSSKHAPTEMSSKRPITRRRTVVETHKQQSRDPRFLDMAGEFSPDKFRQNYNFLTDSHQTELQTLRNKLKKARKLISSVPRDSRAEHELEIDRLERAVKRAETAVHRDKVEKIEQDALRNAKKQEGEKRKDGKGKWFLKRADKRELLTKARYAAVEEEGGKRAVKKAIAKKQKKNEQKEKKSRPRFLSGQEARISSKRAMESDSSKPRKRQRLS